MVQLVFFWIVVLVIAALTLVLVGGRRGRLARQAQAGDTIPLDQL